MASPRVYKSLDRAAELRCRTPKNVDGKLQFFGDLVRLTDRRSFTLEATSQMLVVAGQLEGRPVIRVGIILYDLVLCHFQGITLFMVRQTGVKISHEITGSLVGDLPQGGHNPSAPN
jgi:hypothetical protein